MCSPPSTSADDVARTAPREWIVAAGDLRTSRTPGDRLVAHALGSCLGVAVFDRVAGVGGLLHVALPSASADPARGRERPLVYVDTAVPALFRACYRLGARKERLRVAIAGGAASSERADDDGFQIGRRNLIVLRKLLWRNGVLIQAQDVGGVRTWRTLSLDIATGCVVVRSPDGERAL